MTLHRAGTRFSLQPLTRRRFIEPGYARPLLVQSGNLKVTKIKLAQLP